MALYLKYRPQSFADVVGQDHVVTTLERTVSRNQLAHAYLLCGTRGTGKTSVARILAKSILLQGITDEKIRAQMIKAIEEGSLVDLVEIDAASNRKIEDVRDLIEKIGFAPAISKAKVYIIDEVHMLTKDAFNALLKTLEEPPDYAYFILATTELHKVPDTIQSRCQRFLFKRVKDDDLIRRLQFIVDQEKITIDRDALRSIARHADGSFRDGISLLDQLHSLEKITLKDVMERAGNSVGNFVEILMDAVSSKDAATVMSVIGQIEESNIPLDLIASAMLGEVREGMHEAIDEKQDIEPFIRMTDTLLTAVKNIRLSPVPGLMFESALLSLCSQQGNQLSEPKAKREEPVIQIRKPEPEAVKLETVKKAETAPEEKPVERSALIEAEEFTVQNVLKNWEAILKAVNPPSARMSLKNGTIAAVEGDTLKLGFSSAFHRDKVSDIKASHSIEEALQTIFKKRIRIQCSIDKDAKPMNVGPTTDLVEAAAEVFGGM